ncbi:ADP-ribose pyrophosphatase [Streptomyces olivaceus]|uniref:ADP-ribose pyrophosphatase n=1 Tax=Streptomyces olivaceus TaxID=47716 RepID=UPI003810EE48
MTAPGGRARRTGGTAGAPELLESRLAYRNPWMTVREDSLRRPDGSDGLYGVVDKPDFVLIVPHERNGFHLVEQYRYPVGGRFWEFPQGSWPEPAKTSAAGGDPEGAAGTGGPSPDAVALARAELREETGLVAGSLTRLGRIHVAHGYSSQGCQVFLAEDLTHGEPCREATEADMAQRWVDAGTLDEMVADGRFVDAPSLAALALLQRRPRGDGRTGGHR